MNAHTARRSMGKELDTQDNQSRVQYAGCPSKNLAENSNDHVLASRKWFAALLWKAFPARSEHEICTRAALALDVSPRQVKNWLRCENSAAMHYVVAVMMIAGFEIGFRALEGRG